MTERYVVKDGENKYAWRTGLGTQWLPHARDATVFTSRDDAQRIVDYMKPAGVECRVVRLVPKRSTRIAELERAVAALTERVAALEPKPITLKLPPIDPTTQNVIEDLFRQRNPPGVIPERIGHGGSCACPQCVPNVTCNEQYSRQLYGPVPGPIDDDTVYK